MQRTHTDMEVTQVGAGMDAHQIATPLNCYFQDTANSLLQWRLKELRPRGNKLINIVWAGHNSFQRHFTNGAYSDSFQTYVLSVVDLAHDCAQ